MLAFVSSVLVESVLNMSGEVLARNGKMQVWFQICIADFELVQHHHADRKLLDRSLCVAINVSLNVRRMDLSQCWSRRYIRRHKFVEVDQS